MNSASGLAADNSKELAPVVSAHSVSEKIIAMSRLPHVAGAHVGVECSSARLGGERSMRTPGPCRINGRTGGRSLLLLACREVALGGCVGGWAHPRAAATHAPRGRSRFPEKKASRAAGGAACLPSPGRMFGPGEDAS